MKHLTIDDIHRYGINKVTIKPEDLPRLSPRTDFFGFALGGGLDFVVNNEEEAKKLLQMISPLLKNYKLDCRRSGWVNLGLNPSNEIAVWHRDTGVSGFSVNKGEYVDPNTFIKNISRGRVELKSKDGLIYKLGSFHHFGDDWNMSHGGITKLDHYSWMLGDNTFSEITDSINISDYDVEFKGDYSTRQKSKVEHIINTFLNTYQVGFLRTNDDRDKNTTARFEVSIMSDEELEDHISYGTTRDFNSDKMLVPKINPISIVLSDGTNNLPTSYGHDRSYTAQLKDKKMMHLDYCNTGDHVALNYKDARIVVDTAGSYGHNDLLEKKKDDFEKN